MSKSEDLTQLLENPSKTLETIWLYCESNSVATVGLKRTLEQRMRVHVGWRGPSDPPSLIILCLDDAEGVSERIRLAKEACPDTLILAFGLGKDLSLAQAALLAGACGFVHAGMRPKQIIRAVEIAAKGEMVAPRQLLPHLIERLMADEEDADIETLSARQREILALVVEGLSNAEIGMRMHLSESTIKQHLRAAYKLLGVSNRTEASKLVRQRLRT